MDFTRQTNFINIFNVKVIKLFLAFFLILYSFDKIYAENISENRCNLEGTQIRTLAQKVFELASVDQTTIDLATNFFQIVASHKKHSLFFGSQGPSQGDFSFCSEPFGILSKENEGNRSVLFFNWNYSIPKIMQLNEAISKIYGSNVYQITAFPLEQLTTTNSQFLLPSLYLIGSSHFTAMNTIDLEFRNSRFSDTKAFGNPKQTGEFYDSLGVNSISVFNFDHMEFMDGILASLPENLRNNPDFVDQLNKDSFMSILKVVLHEPVHTRQLNDLISGKFGRRKMVEQYSESIHKVLVSSEFPGLEAVLQKYRTNTHCFAYKYNSIDRWSKEVKQNAMIDLGKISEAISEIKTISPELYQYIRSYEYVEGIPEYVRAQSLEDVGLLPFNQGIVINLLNDSSNPLFYQTGAIAVSFMKRHLGFKAFEFGEDRNSSIWEILSNKFPQIPESWDFLEMKPSLQLQCNLEGPKGRGEVSLLLDYLIQGKVYLAPQE